MYKSLKKAEEAALNGEIPEPDTQDCLAYQLEILVREGICS
jgi:hypothetical protein